MLLGYGFRDHNLLRICLTTTGENERAIRAYAACGFVGEGRFGEHAWSDGRYVDRVLMGILRREWEARRGA